MDNSSSERSPSYTDSSPGSFGQMNFWESDVSNTTSHRRKPTYPLFGLDHVKEIEGLVEDKDVASKAVTFVVNGTRKGVVPLCADVACLMRVKQRLEQTVEKQRREIEHLRSLHNSRASTRTSRSTSPTPPSVESDETNLQKITSDQCSLCSRCSLPSTKCSPAPSSSGHLSQTFEQTQSSVRSKEDSSQVEGTNTDILGDHQHVIRAEVHTMPINTAEVIAEKTDHVTNDGHLLDDDHDADDHDADEDDEDTSDSVTVVEPHPVHAETFQSDYEIQSKLEADLESARKEIFKLRSQLHASPAKELNTSEQSEMACEMNIIDETSTSFSSDSSLVCLPHIQPSSQSNVVLVKQATSSHSSNCCCAKCRGYKEEERTDKQEDCSSSMTEISALEHHSNRCHGHSVPVQLNDRVVIRGGRIGHIRYIGLLNHGNSNTKSTTYLGLQLDEPHGHHDGIHNGKRYFWCHRNHGIFVPIQDVLSVIKSKTSRPQTVKSSRKGSVDHSKMSALKREKSGTRNRVAPALLPTPPTTAKPKKEFLSGT